MNTAELFDELARRPDIDVVDTRYRELLATVRDTLVAELGLAPWIPSTNSVNASTGSGPYARLGGDGEIRRYSSGRSPGTLSDADWPRATSIVADLAAQYGFAAPTVVVDRPGDHEVSLRGEYGGELLFGTAANTTLSLRTGCHLTREAYLRGPSRVEEERPAAAAPEPTLPPEPSPPPPATPPVPRPAERDFDQVDFVTASEPQRPKPAPRPDPRPDPRPAPPEPPQAVAPKRAEPSRRRRPRPTAMEEDFDTMEFIRKKK